MDYMLNKSCFLLYTEGLFQHVCGFQKVRPVGKKKKNEIMCVVGGGVGVYNALKRHKENKLKDYFKKGANMYSTMSYKNRDFCSLAKQFNSTHWVKMIYFPHCSNIECMNYNSPGS